MKKLILLLLLVCTGTTLSWAQGSKRVTVSGTVVDGDSTGYRTVTFFAG